jgi:GxxExxY protein
LTALGEKVYANALAHVSRKFPLALAHQQKNIIMNDGVIVGAYNVELLVDGTVSVELTAIKNLDTAHTAQCIGYLKATGLHLCLLLNFGKPRREIQGIVHGH